MAAICCILPCGVSVLIPRDVWSRCGGDFVSHENRGEGKEGGRKRGRERRREKWREAAGREAAGGREGETETEGERCANTVV